jgi:hypothetical protein
VYTWAGFEPHVTFEVPNGWEGGHTHNDFFDVWNAAYVGFMRPETLNVGSGTRLDASELDAAATAEAIAGREGVDASGPFRTAVGGAVGFGIDVAAKHDVPMFGLEGEQNDVPVAAGWRFRYRAVDVDGTIVLVVTGVPPDGTEAMRRGAEKVVHTVEWGTAARPIPMEGDGTPLEPGAYFHPGYAPGVSFDVGEGWTGGHLHDEFFDVQQQDLLVGFADPAFVVRADGGTTPVGRLDAAGATRLMAQTLGLDHGAVGPCPDFRELHAVCMDAEPQEGTEVFGGADGRLMLEAGSFDRLAVLEIDDDVVIAVVLIHGGPDDQLLDNAEAVLRTARWG